MNDIQVSINNTDISVKEYNGQRVVTFKDIDKVHGRRDGTARKRFNGNKKRFIEGEDYFVRNTDEAKEEFDIIAPNGLTLITESGYLLLVKSFTDDLAWAVQRELVKSYFKVKKRDYSLPNTIETDSIIKYYEKDDEKIPVITLTDLTIVTGINRQTLRRRLSSCCVYGKDYVNLKRADLYYFKLYNNILNAGAGMVIVLPSGLDKLRLKHNITLNGIDTIEMNNSFLKTDTSQIQTNDFRQNYSALEVLAAQYSDKNSDEDNNAISKCFDLILSDIKKKALAK